ncbi:protein OSB2, chloroplastic-like isoform X2 [Telopea speciosissima]|uniref:protein OSB2, chloroplastic-like isoform X2 n=1 Tax=Telopea speciosissima TaxID=54955 RepID=UPI001CC4C4E9|nr:protein OSB2, chloroplastic-like isoform X2 [Telopea speciosissima]
MVQSVSFVQDSTYKKEKRYAPHKHYVGGSSHGIMKDNISVKQYWNQLLAKPHEWLDKRLNKNIQTGADFEHKGSGKLLWIDESTPEWILSKLESMTFAHGSEKSQKSGEKSTDSYWTELVNNPERWRDYREHKMNGKVKPRHPDFKCKEDGHSLWLNTAPISVLPKLEGLEFDVECSESSLRKDNKNEESWKNLVENPEKWWDNRLDKKNKKAPDFKHKFTGEGLWVDRSPAWVLPKLPPLKAEKNFEVCKRDSLLS